MVRLVAPKSLLSRGHQSRRAKAYRNFRAEYDRLQRERMARAATDDIVVAQSHRGCGGGAGSQTSWKSSSSLAVTLSE
jgi:hypothetical protein